MTWVKLDDRFAGNPKVIAAGPEPMWLYVAGLCWCAQNLTDGRIPKAVLPILSTVKRPPACAQRLVEVGLWIDDGDGYEVHDYLEFQPSKAKVEAEREAAKERQRKSREGRAGSHAVTDGVSADAPTRPDPGAEGFTPDNDHVEDRLSSSSGSGPHWEAISEAGLIAARSRVPQPTNFDGFATSVAQTIHREQGWQIAELLRLRPDLEDTGRLALVLATDGAGKAIAAAKEMLELAPLEETDPDFIPVADLKVVGE